MNKKRSKLELPACEEKGLTVSVFTKQNLNVFEYNYDETIGI